MMNIKPIHTESDYLEALKIASRFFDNEPEIGTPEGDEFDVLLTLIESYESKNFPIGLPDPIEAIKFRLDQTGKSVKDLAPIIGKMNRVYEVLNGTRPLTLNMIRNLHIQLGVPAGSLIMQSEKVVAVGHRHVTRYQNPRVGVSMKISSSRRVRSKATTRVRQKVA